MVGRFGSGCQGGWYGCWLIAAGVLQYLLSLRPSAGRFIVGKKIIKEKNLKK